jgi:hypothetical protein
MSGRFPDDGAPGEPLPTGFVQVGLSGDRQLAQAHLRDARRMLGRLRANHGIDARIADGQPGGFFTHTATLPDGTRVTVTSNNGQDTVRIAAPLRAPPPVAPLPVPPAVPQHVPRATLAHHAAGVTHLPPLIPSPPPQPVRPEDVVEEQELGEYVPYLWIGVRTLNPDQRCRVHACVWEPPAAVGVAPLILSNRNLLLEYLGVPPTAIADRSIYPLGPWEQFSPADPDQGVAYTDQHLCMLLPHNGYPMRIPDYNPARDEDIAWDVIFVSDTENDLQLLDQAGLPMLGRGSGDYYLKVMVLGPDCPDDLDNPPAPQQLELRIITGKRAQRLEVRHQVTIAHFTQCPSGILPFGFFDEDMDQDLYPCYGTNPHAEHWWQGMGRVLVPPPQYDVPVAELAMSVTFFSQDGVAELPPTGFDAGDWPDMCPDPGTIDPPPPVYEHVHQESTSCGYKPANFITELVGLSLIHEHREVYKQVSHSVVDYTRVTYADGSTAIIDFTSSASDNGWQLLFEDDITWDAFVWGGAIFEPGHPSSELNKRTLDAIRNDTCS